LHLPFRKIALLCALTFAAVPIVAAAAPVPADTAGVASAPIKADTFAPGARGIDVSWPQCPDQIPAGEANYVIVGVTGGKAFTRNECFRRQFDWANTARTKPQVYTNVNGVPRGYTNAACDAADVPCNAYRYGWDSAIDAVNFAHSQQAEAQVWWLDVETMNYWTPDKWTNAWTVRGAIEALQSVGKSVGIYSTPYQWDAIAGGYAPQLPVWTAGAENLRDAQGRSNGRYEFGGGKVALVQYIENDFDTNFACMPMPVQTPNLGAQATIPPATTPQAAPKVVPPASQSRQPEQTNLATPTPPPAASSSGQSGPWPLSIAGQPPLWNATAANESQSASNAADPEFDPAGASNAHQLRRILSHRQ
jgi:hypothetical protein